jgi:site-specific DNA recombinase
MNHTQGHAGQGDHSLRYAAIYARVSTEDQGKGFSIPTQIEACQKLAECEGYLVPEAHVLIDEGISGTTMDRSQLRTLRGLVSTRAIAAAIVYDPDRLSRNLGHQLLLAEEFERAGVTLLIVSHPLEQGPEGWLFFQMRGALAEYERAKTLERTKRGLVGRAKSGQVNGGRVALGYRYLSGPHQGRLEIHEEEAALICQIFHWALDGCSVRAIARRLTDARVPTATDRRGFTAPEGRKPCKQEPPGVWSLSSVGLILRNPVYMGQMRYNTHANLLRNGRKHSQRQRPPEEWVTIPVPAIIAPDMFVAVQARLQANRHIRPSKGPVLLRGQWFRCGRCGCGMTPLVGRKYRYYRCGSWYNKMAPERRCPGTIRADVAEREVWQVVMQILEHPDVVQAEVAKQQATIETQIVALDAELTDVNARLARIEQDDRRLVEAYVGGAFTPAELKVYRADVTAKRTSVEAYRQELMGRREALQHQTGQSEALVDYCQRVRGELRTFSLEEQHLTFDALALRVTWFYQQPLQIEASIPIVESSTFLC